MHTRERLQQLKEALLWGDPLDDRARLDLLGIIESAAQQQPRGRPADQLLRSRAGVVGVLVEKHRVALKTALFAAAPQATARQSAIIAATYRALRASGDSIQVPERAVRAALSILDHRRK